LTGRKHEATARAVERWEAVLSQIPDLVVQVDPEGRIVWTNRPGEVASAAVISDLADDPEEGRSLLERIVGVVTGGGSGTFELRAMGGGLWSCRIGAVRHRDQVIGAVIVARDVSAQQETARELQMATAQLVQAQKLSAIGQLAAGVAHELNTPIQFVSDNTVYVQRALEKVLPLLERVAQVTASRGDLADLHDALEGARLGRIRHQLPRAIEQSLEGLGRVSKIVRAMKDFGHPSGGVKEPVDLVAALDSVATMARHEWKYVADLEITVEPDLPPVWLLRDEFNQVVLNLLVNAADAVAERYAGTDRRGRIALVARRAADQLELRISDDGTGIPEAIRNRVFEPFFTTKPVGRGTGQGLAIAYAVVVEKHGGTIALRSEVGVGTEFVVRLPLGAPRVDADDRASA
jgi:signal transduction histidine kinase